MVFLVETVFSNAFFEAARKIERGTDIVNFNFIIDGGRINGFLSWLLFIISFYSNGTMLVY